MAKRRRKTLIVCGACHDHIHTGRPAQEARHQLDIAIDWGRYAELFDYNTATGELVAEPAQRTTRPEEAA